MVAALYMSNVRPLHTHSIARLLMRGASHPTSTMHLITSPKAILASLLLLCTLTACKSSSPDIPDEEPRDGVSYRSTDESKDGAEPADPSALTKKGGDEDAAKGEPFTASGPVAIVNSEPITAKEFDSEMQKLMASGQLPPHIVSQLQGEQREELKTQIIESMVVRRLIEQAIDKNPMEITQDDVTARIKQMEDELSIASQGRMTTIDQMMQQMGMTQDELIENVKQSLALEQIVRKSYDYDDATEADAKEYYEGNLAQFQQPEQVRARHILLKVADPDDEDAWIKSKKEITKIHKKAAAPDADFIGLAKEFSQDGSAPQGGDLGYFPRNAMVPEFEEIAFGLENGGVSEPFRSRFGWHIVKRVDYKAAGPVPFTEIEEQLTTQLTGMKFQESLERYVAELQQTASVELKLENIK